MKFILIRHGKTRGNIEHRYIGSRTDEALYPDGVAQLKAQHYPDADAVFSSPMKRCIETAGIIYPEKPILIIDGFQECDFGAFEGHNYNELKDNSDYQAWLDSSGELPFPGGESRKQFSERCVKAFKAAVEDLAEGSYAFIIHGGTIMAIMAHYTKGNYYDFQVSNGKGFILHGDGRYEVI